MNIQTTFHVEWLGGTCSGLFQLFNNNISETGDGDRGLSQLVYRPIEDCCDAVLESTSLFSLTSWLLQPSLADANADANANANANANAADDTDVNNLFDGDNNNESGFGAFLDNSSIDTTFLDNTLIESDDNDTNDRDLFDGGNNNGSGSSAFRGNSSVHTTTFLDNTSIDCDDGTTNDTDLFVGGNNNGSGSGAFLDDWYLKEHVRRHNVKSRVPLESQI